MKEHIDLINEELGISKSNLRAMSKKEPLKFNELLRIAQRSRTDAEVEAMRAERKATKKKAEAKASAEIKNNPVTKTEETKKRGKIMKIIITIKKVAAGAVGFIANNLKFIAGKATSAIKKAGGLAKATVKKVGTVAAVIGSKIKSAALFVGFKVKAAVQVAVSAIKASFGFVVDKLVVAKNAAVRGVKAIWNKVSGSQPAVAAAA